MFGKGIAFLLCAAGGACAAPVVAGFEHAPDPGRLLATELSCAACHGSEEIGAKGGAVLDGVGSRLQAAWVRDFLTNPQATKPGTTMPDVFAGLPDDERAEKVGTLVHFLASQKSWKAPRLHKYSAPHTGGALFSKLGCAACHADPIKGKPVEGLVSLADLKEKYSYPALTDFLQHPLKQRPSGRMPSLQLAHQEAADIAAYLIDTLDVAENAGRGRLVPFEVDKDKARVGAELFRKTGCDNCHSLAGIESELKASPFDGGGSCKVAHYSLSGPQQAALAHPLRALDAKASVAQTMATLNCYACHARDGIGGPSLARQPFFSGDETLGNEGRFPPHLTGVGAKLKGDWLTKVLAGEGAVRPYVATRMPVFGEHNVAHLAEWLTAADGVRGAGLPEGDVENGRVLLGTQGGVGCISCHGVGGRKGLAMHALSLDGAAERYHPDWFKRNLIDPISTRPGTLMPSFWPGGVAGNKAVLGGDTDAQIAAIWSYLGEENVELPPGYPEFESGEFEISPTDRPVVQRTMVRGAGNHAIAVGFPEGVHFVFDAEQCRLAIAWRGRFIDGYKSWFSRKHPTAEPLGEEVTMFANPSIPDRRFRGYVLDEGGVPTFLFHVASGEASVRFEPNGDGGFEKVETYGEEISRTTVQW